MKGSMKQYLQIDVDFIELTKLNASQATVQLSSVIDLLLAC